MNYTKSSVWRISIAGWIATLLVLALFPVLQLPAVVTLVGLLISKGLSLFDGVIWIWRHGEAVTNELSSAERDHSEWNEEDRRNRLFEEFAAKEGQISLFGVFDWQWLQQVDVMSKGRGFSRTGSTCLFALRNIYYRFEALMVLSTMAMICGPYSSGNPTLTKLLMIIIAVTVLCDVTLMSLEILFGNVIMERGYDRYCHRHVEYQIDFGESDGRGKLKSIWNFVRLTAFSLIAIAAQLQCLHAIESYDGFHGIDSTVASNRLETYGKFVAFTLTTFATVGYGDVYPKTLYIRLFVGYLHVLGMGMVLVLLQVVLGKLGWPEQIDKKGSAK